jgi:hypothetical protein
MVWVEKAEYLEDYKINVTFNDGTEGILDMKSILENDERNIFRELLNEENFKRFRVELDTIVWENGLDLAPEFIKENSKMPVTV